MKIILSLFFFIYPGKVSSMVYDKKLQNKKKLFEELKKNNITFIDLTNKKYLNFDQKIYLDELVKS